MEKSTESLSDSDTSSSWVFVDDTPTPSGTNTFYLNCSREPIQELTENDLGTVGSDIESDTDGISIISESEDNASHGNISEDCLREFEIVNCRIKQNIGDKSVSAERKESLRKQYGDIIPTSILINNHHFKKIIASLCGVGFVVASILLVPYMKEEIQCNIEEEYFNTLDNKRQEEIILAEGDKKYKNVFWYEKDLSLEPKEAKLPTLPISSIYIANSKAPEEKENRETQLKTSIRCYKKIEKNTIINEINKEKDQTQAIHVCQKCVHNFPKNVEERKSYDKYSKSYKKKMRSEQDEQIRSFDWHKYQRKTPNKLKDKEYEHKNNYGTSNTEKKLNVRYENKVYKETERKLKIKEEYLRKKEEFLVQKEYDLLHREIELQRKLSKKHIVNEKQKVHPKETNKFKRHYKTKKRKNKYKKKEKCMLINQSKVNKSLTGDWYKKLHEARSAIRKKEHITDWIFDRAEIRNKRRNKAQWYFQWMADREQFRYRRNSRPYSS